MAFTADEKSRIRHHLGYGSVQSSASLQFGLPRPIQTAFLLEDAMNLVILESEDRIRRTLKIMDDIECKLEDATNFLVAAKLGELELRENHPDLLEKEYARWGMRLADDFMLPLYPYSRRFQLALMGNAGSIPVRH